MLAAGVEIEGYRIERLLGRGGMGEVYEATQLELDRRVAFKVLHADLRRDAGFRERFRREGRLQATLDHPNIVTVYEAGELDEGSLFIAMQLVAGVTLKELISNDGLDVERAIALLRPVASALDLAHANGLVHRDVKSQNILVSAGERAFLADFGLTRGPNQSALTRTGQVVGTIDYIAPEQVRGEPAGTASDVYSFSGVIYECLTGSAPYVRPSDAAVLYAHLNDEPPRPSALKHELPAGVDTVLARGMAKEPEERPGSAGELIAAVAAELRLKDKIGAPVESETIGLGTTAVGRRRVPGSSPRLRLGAALLPGLGLAALAALAFTGGRAVGGGDPERLSASASSAAVSLRAPAGWEATAVAERPAIPGLRLRNVVGVAPAQRDGSGALAGISDARGPRLVPDAFANRPRRGLPRPAAVRLGEMEALRYSDVALRGFDRRLTLYAAPSSTGVLTTVCYSPQQAPEFAARCEAVAQSIELLRGRPFPLAVKPGTERAIVRSLSGLRRARVSDRRRLAQASTEGAQAASAARLAEAYARARRRLGRLQVSPAIVAQMDAVLAAAGAAGAGYRRLSASARKGDPAAYEAARRDVKSGEAQLGRALTSLEHDAARGRPM